MVKLYQPSAVLTLLTGLLLSTNVACGNRSDLAQSTETSSTTPMAVKNTSNSVASPAVPAKASTAKIDPYQLAVERASSAYTMGKSAQSRDDWRLVATRWQQAIEFMKSVPAASSHREQVPQKLVEYQRNLAYAQQQASRSTTIPNPDGVIVLSPNSRPQSTQAAPAVAAVPQSPQSGQPSGNRVFYAPIVRREGNTPVIRVMFNNQQPFDMIVDTGASGTLITRQMANALKVTPVAQTNVDTASQKGVTFPLGYIKSVEVGGAVANNMLVAIAGSELDIGLLGHDFFGHYDVTIRQNEVEFRERQ